MRENEKYAKMLEDYDRTGKFPLEKIKRSFTLKRMTVDKLKKLSKQKRKSMSSILDRIVEEAT
jgi:hypothetical protein